MLYEFDVYLARASFQERKLPYYVVCALGCAGMMPLYSLVIPINLALHIRATQVHEYNEHCHLLEGVERLAPDTKVGLCSTEW